MALALAALVGAQLGGVNLRSPWGGANLAPAAATRVPAGINAEPSMRPWRLMGPNPDGWWCVQPNCYQNPDPRQTIDTELRLAKNLGARVVRIEFPWFLIQPTRGSYDFGRADFIVHAAAAAGVQLQPVLVYSPSWAGAAPNSPPSAADWSAFVKTMVSRYPSIRYWEMWNEPDLSKYFAGTEAQYVQDILIPGYRSAKAANPSTQIVLGGPSAPNASWADAIYSLGGGASFDILAFHDYGGNPVQDATTMSNVLRAHNQSSKPLWLGEYGVQQNSIHDSSQQSLMTAVLTSSSPLSMAIWYNLRDDYSMSGCCSSSDIRVAGFWGLVQHDNATLKDGYTTMRQLLTGSSSTPPSPSSPSPSPISSPSATSGSGTPPTASPHPSSEAKVGTDRNGKEVLFKQDFKTSTPDRSPDGWTSGAGWVVKHESQLAYLEHTGDASAIHVENPGWSAYAVTVLMRPSGWASEHDGILFGYQGDAHYSLDIVGGDRVVLTRTAGDNSTQLAAAEHPFEPSRWYSMQIDVRPTSIVAYVDGQAVLSANEPTVEGGTIGLESNDPASFTDVVVKNAAAEPYSDARAPSPVPTDPAGDSEERPRA